VSELKSLARLLAQTIGWLHRRHPALRFVSPFVNAETRAMFEHALQQEGLDHVPLVCVEGESRAAVAAADVVLCASGTATLETLLIGRPMVVTYRVSWLSAWLVRLFSHVRYYAMPNHLAGRGLVPELLQDQAVPEKLGAAVEYYLARPPETQDLLAEFRRIATTLRGNAGRRAADAVIELLAAGRAAS
jgi:lipid-A-disaccharide synthase